MNIYLETDGLISKADDMREIATYLNENMKKIENLVINLGLDWQGKSEIAYAAKILFVKKQFDTLYDFIIEYTETIYSIVNEYENIENQLLSQMEG